MKKRIILAVVALLVLSFAIAQAQTETDGDDAVNATSRIVFTDRCTSEMIQEFIPATCSEPRNVTICDDALNVSCREETHNFYTPCGSVVEREIEHCTADRVTIDGNNLSITGYVCSSEIAGQFGILTCDNKYDGNGDGVCASGESCVRFTSYNGTLSRQERNSGDQFVSSDDSYSLQRPGVSQ